MISLAKMKARLDFQTLFTAFIKSKYSAYFPLVLKTKTYAKTMSSLVPEFRKRGARG